MEYAQAKVDEIKAELMAEIEKQAEAILNEKVLELQTELTKTVEKMLIIVQQYVDDVAVEIKAQVEAKVQEAVDAVKALIDAALAKLEDAKNELEEKLEAEKLAILAIIQQQVDEIKDKAKELENILVEYAIQLEVIKGAIEELGSAIAVLDGRLDEIEETIKDLEDRIAALENDNHMVETMAVLLLTAGTILSFGAVYFIFGNRFFPVDTRRSYQHVYIKDGTSKIKHTKSSK